MSSLPFTIVPTQSPDGWCIKLVKGHPDCAHFYKWIHRKLREQTYIWPPKIQKPTSGRQGNLGEFLSYQVVSASMGFNQDGYTLALMGALTPLQDGAPTGLDTTIIYLDPRGNTANDCLYIMEVKTTGSAELSYASELVKDYQKLLGTTAVAGSLGQRFNWLAGYLKVVHKFSDENLERIGDLYHPTPKGCTRIKLLPTLVHDRKNSGSTAPTLNNVAGQIGKQGWPKGNIEAWGIAINNLLKCFVHLSNNESTMPL